MHYAARIQLSEGGIAVNDINHAPTQRVVEAFEVLLGKCIRGPEKGTNYTSCQSQTRVHLGSLFIYLLIHFNLAFHTALTGRKYSISQLPFPRPCDVNYSGNKTTIQQVILISETGSFCFYPRCRIELKPSAVANMSHLACSN